MIFMWKDLPENQRNEYRRMILAFASLTEMFAQKAENGEDEIAISPIINSKYQETIFQRVFDATAEDIGNTSYDASIRLRQPDGREIKYLIGIKTFGIASGSQKIAQFKANHDEWSPIINQMRANASDDDGTIKSKDAINEANAELYMKLAKKIAELRNARIKSSESKLQGFSITAGKDNVQAVYHVLMPSKKGDSPVIYVGETAYTPIDIEKLDIKGCTGVKNPTNFDFTDGHHNYRFTSADSQLLMDFDNSNIVEDKWDVVYADDAYALFSNLADQIYGKSSHRITESYSWMITNKKGEVESFSGFNSFYGVGSKLGADQREKRIENIIEVYQQSVNTGLIERVTEYLRSFLLQKASTKAEKEEKILLRDKIVKEARSTHNMDFVHSVEKLVYRPKDELYIPIPNSRKFHDSHPDFFGEGIGTFRDNSKKLAHNKDGCQFNLIFEPSGDCIRSYITQDDGKAIESVEKQSYLGEWILRGIFQLNEYEPLTSERLNEIGINGIRLYKIEGSADVHLQFIWIDTDNPPADFIGL